MLFKIFAGAIFTPGEIAVYCVGAFLILGFFISTIIFIYKKLASPKTPFAHKMIQSILIGFISIIVIAILFLVIPAKIKDSNWAKKQQVCAMQAGYSSPADDNSSRATFESQASYRRCLDQ